MRTNPLETTDTLLTELATTDLPVVAGQAALPTTALAERNTAPAPSLPCNPKVVDVTKLPDVMDHNGFTQGAILLRKWLSLPASANPHFAVVDTSTITMDFVLSFSRARKQFDRIFSEKLFVTDRAKAQVATLLKRLGKNVGGNFDFNKPVEQLDPPGPEPKVSFDITFVEVGSVTDPIDALTASLGRFTFRVVVAGHVAQDPTKQRMGVTLTDVGVHVEDRFDFEGFQALGCWNVCTNQVGRLLCGGIEYTNADFRNFRQRTGKGGDIWILSDVKAVRLVTPETFFLP